MRFSQYFKITRDTSDRIMNIGVIIFSLIALIIACLFEYDNFKVNLQYYFLISISFGFLMAFFIWALAIIIAYYNFKSIISTYNSISETIRENYGLVLHERKQNSRYNFLELEMFALKLADPVIKFHFEKKEVWITIFNCLDEIENFQKKRFEIQKKYKKDKVILTGWGLKKIISKKDWKEITEVKIREIIDRLKLISKHESLDIIRVEK